MILLKKCLAKRHEMTAVHFGEELSPCLGCGGLMRDEIPLLSGSLQFLQCHTRVYTDHADQARPAGSPSLLPPGPCVC